MVQVDSKQKNISVWVNRLIRQTFHQRLWVLAAVLVLCYPVVVRIVRDTWATPPAKREHSPFVYLMR
mgnify:CR=1 FL=1